ncbi:MAG TPA: Zn-dependent hydrolase [bacterium]|nr:Zn-dependent hydrolase [bacterium]
MTGDGAAAAAVNGERLWDALMTMAEVGRTPAGGVRRLALSDDDRRGRDLLIGWLRDDGCAVRFDDLGNIYGRYPGTDPNAAPVVCGSHLDTVPTGGRFDGVLGVLGALEAVRALRDARVRMPRPVEVVCWTNEEGARFAPAMLASGVVCGRFTLEEAYAARDADGRSFGDELRRIGYLGSAEHRMPPAAAYVELHVEQGPILEREGAQVGVVDGVEGIAWGWVEVTGRAAHAGPTPLEDRRDALVAASRIVLGLRALAAELPGVRTTAGRIEVSPNTINVVPGVVRVTTDLRSRSPEVLDTAARRLEALCAAVAVGDGVEVRASEFWRSPPTAFHPTVTGAVAASAQELGYSTRRLWAGAGHDAKYVADRYPAGMIFVPSAGGLSHNEAEWTSKDDCARGAAVLLGAVRRLAGAA